MHQCYGYCKCDLVDEVGFALFCWKHIWFGTIPRKLGNPGGQGPCSGHPHVCSAQHRVWHRTRAWECLLNECVTGEGGLLLAFSHGPLELGEQGVCLFLLGDSCELFLSRPWMCGPQGSRCTALSMGRCVRGGLAEGPAHTAGTTGWAS